MVTQPNAPQYAAMSSGQCEATPSVDDPRPGSTPTQFNKTVDDGKSSMIDGPFGGKKPEGKA